MVEDCGTVLNPMIVDGPAARRDRAWASAASCWRRSSTTSSGQNRSGSFADYLLATAVEIPPIEVISQHTPNRRTPTGSKGMSEGGVMGAIGAVMNAVNDALAPFGVVADRQPLAPDYIRSLVREARREA